MTKLLIIACAALFLFSAIVARPTSITDFEDPKVGIIDILHGLKKEKLSEKTAFVPKLFTDVEKRKYPSNKNLTIKDIACRGVKSLNHLPDSEKNLFALLYRSLAIFSHKVNCTVNPEESYDLQSFVTELHSAFQHYHTKKAV